MLSEQVDRVDDSLDALERALAAVREASMASPAKSRGTAACRLLRAGDAAMSLVVDLIARGGTEESVGVSAETLLEFDGRRLSYEARGITHVASELAHMPLLAAALRRGQVSWMQVRAIIASVKRLPVAEREDLDRLIHSRIETFATADPDRLLQFVDDEVAQSRPDLTLTREDRRTARRFLVIQPRLEGGGRIYGEGDDVDMATIAEALNAAADRPHRPQDDPSVLTRPQQLLDAFVHVCEQSLSGDAQTGRPRPRLYATLDVAALDGPKGGEAGRLLWGLPGRSPRLSRVTAETLACDATIVPILMDGTDVLAVGDAYRTFTGKIRTAIEVRDGGCRAPGCTAPIDFCDAHHIDPGKGSNADNGALHCRSDHLRAHRYQWKITNMGSGILEYKIRGRRFITHPRNRPPPD